MQGTLKATYLKRKKDLRTWFCFIKCIIIEWNGLKNGLLGSSPSVGPAPAAPHHLGSCENANSQDPQTYWMRCPGECLEQVCQVTLIYTKAWEPVSEGAVCYTGCDAHACGWYERREQRELMSKGNVYSRTTTVDGWGPCTLAGLSWEGKITGAKATKGLRSQHSEGSPVRIPTSPKLFLFKIFSQGYKRDTLKGVFVFPIFFTILP